MDKLGQVEQLLVNPARLKVDCPGQEATRDEVQTSSIKHQAFQVEVTDPGLADHQAGRLEVVDPGLTDHKSKVNTDLKKGPS